MIAVTMYMTEEAWKAFVEATWPRVDPDSPESLQKLYCDCCRPSSKADAEFQSKKIGA